MKSDRLTPVTASLNRTVMLLSCSRRGSGLTSTMSTVGATLSTRPVATATLLVAPSSSVATA
jgi:hypothetical protein